MVGHLILAHSVLFLKDLYDICACISLGRPKIQIDLEIRERQNIDTNIIELRIYNQK